MSKKNPPIEDRSGEETAATEEVEKVDSPAKSNEGSILSAVKSTEKKEATEQPLKKFSLGKIIILGFFCSLFVGSVLLNISYVLKTELSSLINDAAFHNDKLYVAMHGREPVTIFNPNEK